MNLDLNPPASAAGGYPVNYSVLFQNTSAAPAYSLTMSTERIG